MAVFLLVPWLERRFDGVAIYLQHYDLPVVHRQAVMVFILTLVVWVIVGIRFVPTHRHWQNKVVG